ncbi:hypothetical protein JOB18_044304 [Solea senegalensis]|uniref:Uncharacterized protein n=1 Tax=Solea senegalensis TaxID=28829 RepID=A0AAV6QQ00_SOLSE|nr:hypothetical protein JOB18_044304 [Solea senegalensis]
MQLSLMKECIKMEVPESEGHSWSGIVLNDSACGITKRAVAMHFVDMATDLRRRSNSGTFTRCMFSYSGYIISSSHCSFKQMDSLNRSDVPVIVMLMELKDRQTLSANRLLENQLTLLHSARCFHHIPSPSKTGGVAVPGVRASEGISLLCVDAYLGKEKGKRSSAHGDIGTGMPTRSYCSFRILM